MQLKLKQQPRMISPLCPDSLSKLHALKHENFGAEASRLPGPVSEPPLNPRIRNLSPIRFADKCPPSLPSVQVAVWPQALNISD